MVIAKQVERQPAALSCTHLTGSAVGQAGLVIRRQVEVGGAGTGVRPAGGQEAEVAAAAVVQRAQVFGHCGQDQNRTAELLFQGASGFLLHRGRKVSHAQLFLQRNALNQKPTGAIFCLSATLCSVQKIGTAVHGDLILKLRGI